MAEGVYTNEIQVRNYFPETWLWEDYIIPLTGKRVENFKERIPLVDQSRFSYLVVVNSKAFAR